ncbi:MAG: sterol desaturase family protein [Xanthomonadales bacterium]|nr:sterol desaturase family protein [Xanthomonadales bacterium]
MSAAWLLNQEGPLRLGVFLIVLVTLKLAELRWPRRGDGAWAPRQLTNLALLLLSNALLRVAVPVLAVGVALHCEVRGLGLLPMLALPTWASVVLAVVLMDLAIYWQHRAFHRVPLFWRLHRVHHSDLRFDASLALRFHPLEMLVSMGWKLAVIAMLGAPALAVLLFEIALSAFALFSHADLRLPPALDARLRWLIVTPDVHRVHHAVERAEHDHNYGFCLSVWDRLFGSWQEQPREGHVAMRIGLVDFRAPAEQRLGALLLQPWRSAPDGKLEVADIRGVDQ